MNYPNKHNTVQTSVNIHENIIPHGSDGIKVTRKDDNLKKER